MAVKKSGKKQSKTTQTTAGKLGRAKKPRKSTVRARAVASDLLTPQSLDSRQSHIGLDRRKGGPDLDQGKASRSRAKPSKVTATDIDD